MTGKRKAEPTAQHRSEPTAQHRAEPADQPTAQHRAPTLTEGRSEPPTRAPAGAPVQTSSGGQPTLGRRIMRWGLLTVLVGFILGVAAFAYGYAATDIPDPNRAFQAQTTMVYYADGKSVLGRFATQNRESIPLAEVPQHVQDAVVAAENRTFWTDKGIDPKGILRAAFSNASGNATQGASTITQQYVKILYLSQERTVTRKIREAFLSLKIERQMSKSEILQGYLNTIYFGRGAYGIQAAAHAYFDKDAKDLSVAQGAVLASVLNSPGNLDPADGPDAREHLLERYRYVLNGMAEMNVLPAEVAQKAEQRLPSFPKVKTQDSYGGQRGYMMALVKQQLRQDGFTDSEIEGGGLRVTTTFTKKAMRAAEQGVTQERPKGLKQLHVAAASVDPRTGALRGMYAGQDYLKSKGALNWATAGGSPGSAFKPFALAAGLEDGFSLKSTFQGDSPYVFPNGKQVVNEGPNGGNDYGPHISLLKATQESVNTAFMDLTNSMKSGPKKILRAAVDMGIPRNAPGLKPQTGISLGSATVSPIDMANAYATIADGGQAKKWFVVSKVTSSVGDRLFEQKIHTHQAVQSDVDRDVSYALQSVVEHGTGTNAQSLGRPAAGKTGTATDNNGDVQSSWFVGYTPQLSTAVMYVRGDGNDALNDYLPSYFGADYPTRTWTAIMQKALEGLPVVDFPPPAWVTATQTTHLPPPKPTATPTPTPSDTPSPTDSPGKKQSHWGWGKPDKTQQPSSSPSSSSCSSLVCVGNWNGNGRGNGHGH